MGTFEYLESNSKTQITNKYQDLKAPISQKEILAAE
jgi:hypothetical protein